MSPSRRDEIRMTEEEIVDFLGSHWSMIVGSTAPSGWPHLVTMAYGVVDGAVAFTSFAKAQKIVNLRRDPRITCLIEENQDRYERIRGVQLLGFADVIVDPGLALRVAQTCLEQKVACRGPDATPTPEEMRSINRISELAVKRVVVTVRPDRIISWDHARLGGVY